MKAEEDFVRSLDEKTMFEIANGINKRYRELKSQRAASVAEVSISTIAYGNIVPGYYIPSTTQEAPQEKGQRNDTMANDTDLRKTRDYLDHRLWSIKNDKREALKTQFGLTDDDRPRTLADLKARLTAGMFTLSLDETEYDSYEPFDSLRWRDPAKKEDRPGFDAADKKLDMAAAKVKDAIWVKTNAEDALALLEAFEYSTTN